jgi:hypothetical protein
MFWTKYPQNPNEEAQKQSKGVKRNDSDDDWNSEDAVRFVQQVVENDPDSSAFWDKMKDKFFKAGCVPALLGFIWLSKCALRFSTDSQSNLGLLFGLMVGTFFLSIGGLLIAQSYLVKDDMAMTDRPRPMDCS